MKLKLIAEQTEELPFPIGCPVWYNFPENSSANVTNTDPPILKQGVVESVFFNYGEDKDRSMIYEVVYEGDDGGKIVEEVYESNLSYGASCPVTVHADKNEEGCEDGTILLGEPSPLEPGKFVYTAMIFMERSQARFESGIDAERIRYRKSKSDAKQTAPAVIETPATNSNTGVQKDQQHASKNYPSNANASISGSASKEVEEETVPSSITCESVSKNSSKGADEGGISRKREHDSAGITSPPIPTPKRQLKVDTTSSKNSNSQYSQHSSQKSTNRYSRDSPSISSGMAVGHHEARFEMKLPLWLQRDLKSQRDLYFHLIGSKHEGKRGKRTVANIGHETNCRITVNFSRSPSRRENIPCPPITLTVESSSRNMSAFRFLDDAREKILELLLDYMDAIGDAGSKGKLLHEVASSCTTGDHRPRDSTSCAVRANGTYVSLVELPYSSKERRFHIGSLLERHILGHIKSMRCILKICGKEFRVPLQFCDPHVIVTGQHWKDVDRATELVKDTIAQHMR
eukprot:CAMPEP_0183714476 /NCGR_PEP_ID=MMETSP0737-20130205/8973_1 /TAXON_ID=385413 /ORGANISM="Thalassiosira miniscula, Strain CCMP1093" /LENGTH=515 /DNA_ID=CAMNT_0025943407 /DNA_START=99 /DNA_END=1642 /DNA_ORIENTATION=-